MRLKAWEYLKIHKEGTSLINCGTRTLSLLCCYEKNEELSLGLIAKLKIPDMGTIVYSILLFKKGMEKCEYICVVGRIHIRMCVCACRMYICRLYIRSPYAHEVNPRTKKNWITMGKGGTGRGARDRTRNF